MSDPKFPSIDTVHETLSDLTKLFEDRNALLDSMFRDDKYKDFLLAENIQSLVEADKRDDAAGGKIKKDLANGYEVLKAKTNMQKFASFISPGMLPTLDLSEEGDYDDDDVDEEIEEREETENTEQPAPEKGEKGDKGDPGDTNINVEAPKGNFNNRLTSNSTTQNSGIKLAEGGAVSPSPMMNALNPSAQRPETKSGVKSLESLGLVGKKNVASELTEDLGLEEYKKALADAMALPLKAVAAGLIGLLDSVEVPGGGAEPVKKQVAQIASAFGLSASSKESKTSETKTSEETSTKETETKKKSFLSRLFNRKKKGEKKEGGKSYNPITGGSDYFHPKDMIVNPRNLNNLSYSTEYRGGDQKGGDTTSTKSSKKSTKNIFSNFVQGAKNMFKMTPAGMAITAGTSILNRILGGRKPAAEGSQYAKQDINSLTNQTIEQNNEFISEKTQKMIQKPGEGGADMSGMQTAFAEMMKASQQGNNGIDDSNSVQPNELRISKYLTATLVTTHGGETPHDQ